MQGTTNSGFKFKIPESRLDDMRLLDAIRKADENPLEVMTVVELMLREDKDKLFKHVAEKDGRVPCDKVKDELLEIFAKLGNKGKKS